MSGKDPNLDVFVGNLGASTTEAQLREMFGVVGGVRGVRLLTDKETGRPKGYAFIEYASVEFVSAAVRLLNNAELNGRLLRVSFASSTPGGGVGGHGEGDAFAGLPKPQPGTLGAAVHSLQLHEVWDLLDTLKRLNDEQRLRPILEAHPQLVAATQELKRRMGVQ